MNKDFHYEGTYVAACIAGFDKPGEAQIIAWAAQTVDTCIKGDVDEREVKPFVYTCENILQNIEDVTKDLQNINGNERQKIRKIWMPFHFLPGNFENTTPIFKGEDAKDFACICKPNSELIIKLVNDLRNEYKSIQNEKIYDSTNIQYLFKIGVLMHVLADTWAHQNFAGSPNYNINYCENIKIVNETKPQDCDDSRISNGNFNKHSIVYLGHGCVGHYPDYGCLIFSYRPIWSETSIGRDNSLIFKCAFMQMVQAMHCILNNEPFIAKTESDLLNDFQKMDYHSSVKTAIEIKKDDQSEAWRDEIINNKFGLTHLEEYTLNHNNDDMKYFQIAAQEHRKKVVDYMYKKGINI